jgi:hypothetical protein
MHVVNDLTFLSLITGATIPVQTRDVSFISSLRIFLVVHLHQSLRVKECGARS